MSDAGFDVRLDTRKRGNARWKTVFLLATALSVFFLALLIANVANRAFGYVAIVYSTEPETVLPPGAKLQDMDSARLAPILEARLSPRILRRLESQGPLSARPAAELAKLLEEEILDPQIVGVWTLWTSLASKKSIMEWTAHEHPSARIVFRSWMSLDFILSPQSSDPLLAGIRSAVLGSLITILITALISLPLGIGAAIWLEEYARDTTLNRIIQTNIYNLAGVPSIIYGMLGLAVFVRGMEPVTSGAIFGLGAAAAGETASGRTILSAALTLALLVLPIVIINAQEAIRAVPSGLRHSSLALGATKWQTIWHHVLPSSMDRILTGAVLAISRALGETAPLVVVGASTFLSKDPSGPFSRFTTLPIQIYQWTARPQAEYRSVAAGAILVLLVLLISMNAAAITARNGYR
ncbi:MAG TPA: phosphate ABC transporter permease PstA, partial [Rectinemataceae bacterium]